MKPLSFSEWIQENAQTLLFYLYALLLAPWLAAQLKAGLKSSTVLVWPGVLLMAVMVLEAVGLTWKIHFLRRRWSEAGQHPNPPMLLLFSLAGIGHVIVTVFLGFLAADGWGLIGSQEEPDSAWFGWLFGLLLAKECAAFFGMSGQALSAEPPGHLKEWLADLFLLLFSCAAYTAWWSVLVDMQDLGGLPFYIKLIIAPFLGVLVFMVYLPLRLSFFMEVYYLHPAEGARKRILMECAFGLCLGLYPMFI